jgi:hypothetical protein
VALVERRHDAVRQVHPGQQVGDRDADLGGLLGAGHRHQPALALRDLVVAGPVRLRAVVAEAGDRADDQAGVEVVQPLHGEAEPVQGAGAEVLEQHVGAAHEGGEHVCVSGVLEIEDE